MPLTLHRELNAHAAPRSAALLDTLQRDHPTTPEPPEGFASLFDLPADR
jgi:hypothetical protein